MLIACPLYHGKMDRYIFSGTQIFTPLITRIDFSLNFIICQRYFFYLYIFTGAPPLLYDTITISTSEALKSVEPGFQSVAIGGKILSLGSVTGLRKPKPFECHGIL